MFTKVQDWAIARFINSVNSNPEVCIPGRKEADARFALVEWVAVRTYLMLAVPPFFIYLNTPDLGCKRQNQNPSNNGGP